MMKKAAALIFFSTYILNVSAQEMWGFSNSNFSGNMGIFLNPSTIVAAPYGYEFNLIAADVFAQNTYVYIPKNENVFLSGLTGSRKDVTFLDKYTNKLQNGFGHVLVIGPSFIKNKRETAWGIHTAFRNELSATDVPSSLAKFIFVKYRYQPLINSHFITVPFSAAMLNWAEIGGTYGRILIEKQDHFLKIAVSLNLLAGFDGLYLDARKADYTIIDSSGVIVHSFDATIGHAISHDGNNLFKIRGFGLSTTIGATYIHKRRSGGYDCNKTADNVRKYQYRLGFSLMDFGFIRFSNDAQVMNIGTGTDRNWLHLDTVLFHSVVHLDELLSNNINGTVNTAENKSFTMYLPGAVSVQFDYSFTPHVYGNLSIVNRIKYSPKEVVRGNQVDVSVRYEKRKWEVTGDFTLFEYNQPSFGLGFRYWIFVLGTDRLPELLSLTDVQSFDLFFGFKLNLCDLKGKTKTSCPAFANK